MSELNVGELLSVGELPGTYDHEIVEYKEIEIKPTVSNPDNRSYDLRDDYALVREIEHKKVQILMEATMVALRNAATSDSPKHMEALAKISAQLTASSKTLLGVHKDMRDITSETTRGGSSSAGVAPAANNVGTQNVFIGTPAELMNKVGTQYDSVATVTE